MNCFKTVMKILTALAAIAGAIYIIATYGDKIVAWAKSLLEKCPCKCTCKCEGEEPCECKCPCKCNLSDCKCKCDEEGECECKCDGNCDCECECTCEKEEAPVEEAVPAEEPIEEVIVEAGEPIADEADFAE